MENARFPIPEEPSAPNSANSTKKPTLTPRERRVVDALVATAGWIPREEIDRIAGASNGPAVIKAIREKVTGHHGISMERVERLDRDGLPTRPGRYRLNAIGRFHAQKALKAVAA